MEYFSEAEVLLGKNNIIESELKPIGMDIVCCNCVLALYVPKDVKI